MEADPAAAFRCPKCDAAPDVHGKGRCASRSSECGGFLCECDDEFPESELVEHGTVFSNPCTRANCYHCGWAGTVPVRPKGMQAWERKALEAGWTMPVARAKELGL